MPPNSENPASTLFEIRPLKGEPLGVEVLNFDFESVKSIDDPNMVAIRKALLEHIVSLGSTAMKESQKSMVSRSHLCFPTGGGISRH